jgi:titin
MKRPECIVTGFRCLIAVSFLLFALSCGGGKKSAQPTGPDDTTPVEPSGPTNVENVNVVLGLIQSASDLESGKTAVREAFLLAGLGAQDDNGVELQKSPFFAGLTPFGVEVLAQALIAKETTTVEKFALGLEGLLEDSQGNSLKAEDMVSVLQYVINKAYQDKENSDQNAFLLISATGGSLSQTPPQIGLNTELNSIQSTILGVLLMGSAFEFMTTSGIQSSMASLNPQGILPQDYGSNDLAAISTLSYGLSEVLVTTGGVFLTAALVAGTGAALVAAAPAVLLFGGLGAVAYIAANAVGTLAENSYPNSYQNEIVKENNNSCNAKAPGNLQVELISPNQVRLTWNGGGQCDGFDIEVKKGESGSWDWPLGHRVNGRNTTNFVDSGLDFKTTYFYRVNSYENLRCWGPSEAYRPSCETCPSDPSGEVRTTTGDGPPEVPIDLEAEVVSDTQVNLSWDRGEGTEKGFRIERKDPGGDFRLVGTASAGSKNWPNSELTPNTLYTYRIYAFNDAGQSQYSNEVQVQTSMSPILNISPKTLTFTADKGGPDPAPQTFEIKNLGGGDLRWSANYSNLVVSSISAYSGTAPSTVTVKVSTSGREAKTYSDSQAVIVSVDKKETQYVQVVFNVKSTVPDPPSNFSAAAVSPIQVTLSWSYVAGKASGFSIARKEGSAGTYVWVNSSVSADSRSYQDTYQVLPNQTYTYRIHAKNVKGEYSAPAEASCTTPIPNVAAPTGLQALAVSTKQIDLSWSYSGNVDGFEIYGQIPGGPFQKMGTVSSSAARAYSVTGLYPGQSYTFYVKAIYLGYASNPSNTASATTLAPPAAPTSLSAKGITKARIDLAWQDKSGNENGFRIFRRENGGGGYQIIDEVGIDVEAYSDTSGLKPNTVYYYIVAAFNSQGVRNSNEAQASTNISVGTPTNLQAIVLSSTSVRLTWEDNSDNEEYFWIYMNDVNDGTAYKTWKTTGPNIISYDATGLTPGKTYYFFVRAEQETLFSNASNWATADLSLPSAPTNLQASAFSSTQVNLSFQDNSNNETGFLIQRMDPGTTTWKDLASLGPKAGTGSITHSDTGLTPQTQYFYRVSAHNNLGSSSYSNNAWAVTLPPPALPAPSNLQGSIVFTLGQVNLTWVDTTGEDRYEIYMSEVQNQLGTMVGIEFANVTTHSKNGLISGKTYYFRVKACKGSQCSDPSNQVIIEFFAPFTFYSLGDNNGQLLIDPLATGSTQITFTDDTYIGPINLGFQFNLFGNEFSSVYINSNGNLTFNSGDSTYNNYKLPRNDNFKRVSPFWDDIDFRNGGLCSYNNVNQGIFVVSFVNAPLYGRGTSVLNTFQVILIGTNNTFGYTKGSIIFSYTRLEGLGGTADSGDSINTATVGLNNGDGLKYTIIDSLGSDGLLQLSELSILRNKNIMYSK